MQTHTLGRNAAWKSRLGYGDAPIGWPTVRQTAPAYLSASSGSITVPAGGSILFGAARVPVYATALQVFDGIVQAGANAFIRVDVRKKGDGGSFKYRIHGTPSVRQQSSQEHGGPVASVAMAAGDDVEFVIWNVAVASFTATASITYGFASA